MPKIVGLISGTHNFPEHRQLVQIEFRVVDFSIQKTTEPGVSQTRLSRKLGQPFATTEALSPQ
jgi:hypothetical protein